MIIRCHACHADPCGRWKQPPATIFVDRYRADGGLRDHPVYACPEHVSPRREKEIQRREADSSGGSSPPGETAPLPMTPDDTEENGPQRAHLQRQPEQKRRPRIWARIRVG
jgi:hypothetical protein